MKLFAAFLFLLTSAMGAPVPCAHAAGMTGMEETAAATMHETHTSSDMHASHAHHDTDHSSPDDTHDHDGAHNHGSTNGCETDCKGGAGCEGCTITNAMMSTSDDVNRNVVSHRTLAAHVVAAADKPTPLDPPPPRA